MVLIVSVLFLLAITDVNAGECPVGKYALSCGLHCEPCPTGEYKGWKNLDCKC